jgi:hypothetical protein
MEFAWASESGILWIPTSVKEVVGENQFSDETTYLLENYGAISHVFKWEKPFINNQSYGAISHEDVFKWEKSFINNQSRAAQDSQMLARASESGILWIPTSVKEVDGENQFSDETTYLLENYGAISH